MKLKDSIEPLDLQIYYSPPGSEALNMPIRGVICGDLLSYIIANGQEGHIWLTIQGHQNIVAVASLLNLGGILITGGIKPQEMTIDRAREQGVILLGTDKKTYCTAIELYKLGL